MSKKTVKNMSELKDSRILYEKDLPELFLKCQLYIFSPKENTGSGKTDFAVGEFFDY